MMLLKKWPWQSEPTIIASLHWYQGTRNVSVGLEFIWVSSVERGFCEWVKSETQLTAPGGFWGFCSEIGWLTRCLWVFARTWSLYCLFHTGFNRLLSLHQHSGYKFSRPRHPQNVYCEQKVDHFFFQEPFNINIFSSPIICRAKDVKWNTD